MRIVIIDFAPDEVLTVFLAGNVQYRPDLLLKSPTIIAAALREARAGAVITTSRMLDATLHDYARENGLVLVRVAIGSAPIVVTPEESISVGPARLIEVFGDDALGAYTSAFEALEAYACQAIPTATTSLRMIDERRLSVTLVGAGVVNLITGFALQKAGYAVHVVDAGPDPMIDAPWTTYGCSRGGDDARMFTLSEMDNYNDKAPSPQMNAIFNGNVCELGWGIRKSVRRTDIEAEWVAEYESLPGWLAKRYNADIFAFNRESRLPWDRWIEDEPDIFGGCELREDILRLYADAEHFAVACDRQARIGATKRVLRPGEIASYEPALAEAVAGAQIAGGIVVTGFTVNVHKFMHRLIQAMRNAGATFEWGRSVGKLVFNDRGLVTALDTGDGLIEGSDFVLSPGAYARTLLDGTLCEGKIHGVLGAWLRLPNLEPRLDRSLKLARRGHITEDANITVATDAAGQPIMIIGSGYGHTGIDPRNIDRALLHQVYAGLEDTAERFFPDAYEAARAAGMVEASLRYCVRPWTATGLGLFEMRPTAAGGRCIITGGHNTGGFAQAPAIADAVLAALRGADHAMHRLYHPDRSARFMERGMRAPPAPAQVACEATFDVIPFEPPRSHLHLQNLSA